jgi:Ca-activated chloride channel homolog
VSFRSLSSVVAAVTVMGLALHAQAGHQVPRAFHSGVDVIAMNVTVTDTTRRYVTDLNQQDFQVYEDGKPQEVTFFRKGIVPLALALAIDTSASMDAALPVAQDAAIRFVHELSPKDVACVIQFNNRVQVRQEFTSDHDVLEHAIRDTSADGSTALYNAVYIALNELKKTIPDEPLTDPRRRALVILTDGEDTSSLIGFDEVLDLARRSDAAIYTIGLRSDPLAARRLTEADFVLRRFAEQTGGRAFFATEAKELRGVYAQITADLSNQYVLAYESSNGQRDGGYRHLTVRIEREGVIARTRPGYYAPSR